MPRGALPPSGRREYLGGGVSSSGVRHTGGRITVIAFDMVPGDNFAEPFWPSERSWVSWAWARSMMGTAGGTTDAGDEVVSQRASICVGNKTIRGEKYMVGKTNLD